MICMDSCPGQFVVCEKEAGSTFPTQTVWHQVWWWHWPAIIVHTSSGVYIFWCNFGGHVATVLVDNVFFGQSSQQQISTNIPWCDVSNKKSKNHKHFWCKPPTSPGYDLIDAQIPIEYVSRLAMNQLVSGRSRWNSPWVSPCFFFNTKTIDVWGTLWGFMEA